MMKRPSFIHIGPQRCGTTTLYNALLNINCVSRSVKEIQFFDLHFDLGVEWYLKHFEGLSNAGPVGEVCPSYFDCTQAIERMWKCFPKIRVVCTLRDPLSRIPSYYRLLRMYDQCPEGIETAWEVCDELRDCCMYSKKLAKWQALFGKKQFLIMLFDDLKLSPEKYIADFCSFVGVAKPPDFSVLIPGPEIEPIPRFPILNDFAARAGMALRRRQMYKLLERLRGVVRPWIYNIGAPNYEVEMTALFKARLQRYYKDEIVNLERFFGRNLNSWRTLREGER